MIGRSVAYGMRMVWVNWGTDIFISSGRFRRRIGPSANFNVFLLLALINSRSTTVSDMVNVSFLSIAESYPRVYVRSKSSLCFSFGKWTQVQDSISRISRSLFLFDPGYVIAPSNKACHCILQLPPHVLPPRMQTTEKITDNGLMSENDARFVKPLHYWRNIALHCIWRQII